MRILILGINYFPERTSVSPFTTGLSEHLAAQGHDVQVVTAFPYYPEWRIWEEHRGHITQSEIRNGVRIRRVRHFIPWRASSLVQRLLHDFSFMIGAIIGALLDDECDVVYCSSPPPAVALAAYAVSRIRRVPYIIKLTDLASDAALATGILREGLLVRCARWMETFVYRHASAVLCLCDGFHKRLTRDGLSPNQLHVIPDWGDTEAVQPVHSDGSFRVAHGIADESFVVLHTGNMGKKQDLLNVVQAAELTRSDTSLQWVIVGQGEDRSRIENELKSKNLTNLLLLPLQPAAQLCQMYASADVLLLNQKAAVKDSVIPSKLLTYMAAGKAVLCAANTESEAALLIAQAGCGRVVRPEDPASLIEGVLALRSDRVERYSMGSNGRVYAERNYSKARVLGLYDEFFESFVETPPTVAAVAAD